LKLIANEGDDKTYLLYLRGNALLGATDVALFVPLLAPFSGRGCSSMRSTVFRDYYSMALLIAQGIQSKLEFEKNLRLFLLDLKYPVDRQHH
jgi:hypothetical protein